MGACAIQVSTHDTLRMLSAEAVRVAAAANGQNVFNGRNTLLKHLRGLADQLSGLAEDCRCGTDASGRPELEISREPTRAELGLRFVANRHGGLHLQLQCGLNTGTEISANHARRLASVLISAAEIADAGSVTAGTPLTVICEG